MAMTIKTRSKTLVYAAVSAAAILGIASAAMAAHAASGIITTDGHFCPTPNLCAPIDAGPGSIGYLYDAEPKEGFGYIAIQFGDVPPTEGFVTFLLAAAPKAHQQICAFNVGHTNQGYEWPVTSQIEWWSSNQVSDGRYSTTVKFRAHDLIPRGIYAFTYNCNVAQNNP